MSDYTRYLKCPEHGSFEAHFKTCPQCFPDEGMGDLFEAAQSAEIAELKQLKLRYGVALEEAHKILSTNITQYGVSIHDAVEDAREVIEQALESKEAENAASGGFTGIASNIKKFVTKNNETMATMLINGNECIAFPRTWMQYRKVLESSKELQIVAQEDYSRGYLQMIIQVAELLYEGEGEPDFDETYRQSLEESESGE